jgi:hypothetical protein
MKLKSELYKKEQDEIIDKIMNILKLDNDNGIILRDFDNDIEKQKKIMDLKDDICKYFSSTAVIGAHEPEKAKRPYMSIVKQITKSKYNMLSCDYRIKDGENIIRTKKYIFTKKQV